MRNRSSAAPIFHHSPFCRSTYYGAYGADEKHITQKNPVSVWWVRNLKKKKNQMTLLRCARSIHFQLTEDETFCFLFFDPRRFVAASILFRGGGYFYEVATNANGRHLSDTFCWRFYLTRSGLNKFPSHSQTITRFGAKMFAGGSLAPASPDRKTLTGPGPKYIYIYTAVPPFHRNGLILRMLLLTYVLECVENESATSRSWLLDATRICRASHLCCCCCSFSGSKCVVVSLSLGEGRGVI